MRIDARLGLHRAYRFCLIGFVVAQLVLTGILAGNALGRSSSPVVAHAEVISPRGDGGSRQIFSKATLPTQSSLLGEKAHGARLQAPSESGQQVAYTYVPFNHTLIAGPFSPGSVTYSRTVIYVPRNGNLYVGDQGGYFLGVVNASRGAGVSLISFFLNNGTDGGPLPLVYDPLNNGLFVSTYSGHYAILNLSNGIITSGLGSLGAPEAGAFDPENGRIFLADGLTGNVTSIDAKSGRQLSTTTITGTSRIFTGMVYDVANHLLYVADDNDRCVIPVNATTGAALPFIKVGGLPAAIAVDNESGAVYVANGSDAGGRATIQKIDPTTNKLMGSISVGTGELTYDWRDDSLWASGTEISLPNDTIVASFSEADTEGIAYDSRDNFVYIADGLDTNLSAIDATAHRLRFPYIPFNFGFWFSTYDAVHQRLYAATVSNLAGPDHQGYVTALNASSGIPSFEALVPVGYGPTQVAVDSNAGDLYVSNLGSDSVSILNGTSLALIRSLPISNGPIAVTYDAATGDIYVAQGSGHNVSVIDGVTRNIVVPSLPVGTAPSAIATNPKNGLVYVTNFYSNNVTIINGSTRTIFGPGVGVGTGPEDIVYDPVDNSFYVANSGSSNVSVIDGATGKVVASVALGSPGTPSALAVDPSRNYVYVAEGSSSNVVKVIDGSTNQLVGGPIPVGADPQGLAYDPAADEVYVSNFAGGTIQLLTPPLSARLTPSPTEIGISTKWAATNPTGTPPFAYTYNGLPPGCTSKNVSTLVCTPSVNGVYRGTIDLADVHGNTTVENWNIVVAPRLGVASFNSSYSTVPLGGYFELIVSVVGGVTPFSFLYANLPHGCTTTNGAQLLCRPNATGAFSVVATVSDALGAVATATVAISVTAPVGPPSVLNFYAEPSRVLVGSTVTFHLTVVNGTVPLSVSYSGLPAGCNSVSETNLTCQPRTAGVYTVQVEVQDATGRLTIAQTSLIVTSSPVSQPIGSPPLGSQATTAALISLAAGVSVGAVLVAWRWRRRHGKPTEL